METICNRFSFIQNRFYGLRSPERPSTSVGVKQIFAIQHKLLISDLSLSKSGRNYLRKFELSWAGWSDVRATISLKNFLGCLLWFPRFHAAQNFSIVIYWTRAELDSIQITVKKLCTFSLTPMLAASLCDFFMLGINNVFCTSQSSFNVDISDQYISGRQGVICGKFESRRHQGGQFLRIKYIEG